MKKQESRAFCLSKSKRNMEAWNIIESYALEWGVPNSQAIFRIVREYDKFKKVTLENDTSSCFS